MGIFGKSSSENSSVILQKYVDSHHDWRPDGDAFSKRLEDTFATIRSNVEDEILLSVIWRTEIPNAAEILEEYEEGTLIMQVMPIDEDYLFSIGLVHRPIKSSNFNTEIDSILLDTEKYCKELSDELSQDQNSGGKNGLSHLPRMLSTSPLPAIKNSSRGSDVADMLENSSLHPLIGILRAGDLLGYSKNEVDAATNSAYRNLIQSLGKDDLLFQRSKDFYKFAAEVLAPSFNSVTHPTYDKNFWNELVQYTKILNNDFKNLPNWW